VIRRVALPALALALAACADSARVSAGEDPFAGARDVPAREIGGRVVAEMDGDFVHPAFSPDGRRLAWSEVVAGGGTESTRLGVLELDSRRRRVLVTPEEALGWGVYASFATALEWRGADTLYARLSDGDVGGSTVRMDVPAGRVIDESYDPGGEEDDIPPRFVATRARIRAAFPGMAADRVGAAGNSGSLVDGGDRVLLQHAHADENRDILLLDLAGRRQTTLIRLEDASPGTWRLSGGARVGDALVFLVTDDTAAFFFEHTERGGLRRLGRIRTPVRAWLDPLRIAGDTAFLHLRVGPVRELRDSPLLVYRAGRLERAADFAVLSDAAVDPAGRRVAFVHVGDERRRITVRELR
jgi:hypothetical protein